MKSPTQAPRRRYSLRKISLALAALILPACALFAWDDPSMSIEERIAAAQDLLNSQLNIPPYVPTLPGYDGNTSTYCPHIPICYPPCYTPCPPITPPEPECPEPSVPPTTEPPAPPAGPCNPYYGMRGKMVSIVVEGPVTVTGTFMEICYGYIILRDAQAERRILVAISKILFIEQSVRDF